MEYKPTRARRELIDRADAQIEAHREMAKAGWKADEVCQTPEERRAHKAKKRETGKMKAREVLHQNMAKNRIDINQKKGQHNGN